MAAFVLSALVALCLASAAIAEDKAPISFPAGADRASVKGEIQGMDRDVYPITAKAGQTMRVKVTNAKNLVLFRVQKPGDEEVYLPGAGEDDDATQWEGALPESGAYKIIVGAMQGSDTSYTLDVQISK
jgi:hypothetical protein